MGKDDVGRERYQFCSLFANLSVTGRSPVDVHPHVAAIDPAQLLQRLSKRGQPGLILRIVLGYGQENTDEPHTHARLAPRSGRPCCHRAAEKCDELTPPHSSTWSASCKKGSGTERPRALALLRLKTSSNLSGDCAGRLPGNSPLRMRSTYELERRKISAVSGP